MKMIFWSTECLIFIEQAQERWNYMVGRNDPCVCGSGKKYKRCCVNTNEAFLEQQVAVELHQVLVGAYEQSAKSRRFS